MNHLDDWIPAYLALGVYSIVLGLQIFLGTQWRDLGEGFSVRDVGQRLIYIGQDRGLARCCLDKGKNGTLNATFINMPISPMMGGPGYRLVKVETTEEDRKKFDRANYLLSLENK